MSNSTIIEHKNPESIISVDDNGQATQTWADGHVTKFKVETPPAPAPAATDAHMDDIINAVQSATSLDELKESIVKLTQTLKT